MTEPTVPAADADILDEWAAVGLEEVRLPSGYEVRLRIPKPADLVVRGLLPLQLVQETLAQSQTATGLETVVDDNPALAQKLVDAVRTMAADSIRQTRKSPDQPWRPIVVPVERYVILPPEDREVIEALVESRMADIDEPTDAAGQRRAREEAAGTVDAFREFRDDGRGDDPRPDGADVRPAAVVDDRPTRATGGAGTRPRARRASRGG